MAILCQFRTILVFLTTQLYSTWYPFVIPEIFTAFRKLVSSQFLLPIFLVYEYKIHSVHFNILVYSILIDIQSSFKLLIYILLPVIDIQTLMKSHTRNLITPSHQKHISNVLNSTLTQSKSHDKISHYSINTVNSNYSNNNMTLPYSNSKSRLITPANSINQQDNISSFLLTTKNQRQYKRVPTSPSYKDQADNISEIIRENQSLKLEVFKLQNVIYKLQKNDKLFHIKQQRGNNHIQKQLSSQEQISQLKQLIQKSYYSLKQMEHELKSVKEELSKQRSHIKQLSNQIKIITFEKEANDRKLAEMTAVHKQELKIYTRKIDKLEDHIMQLLKIMEQDKKQWRKSLQDLRGFKRFSVKRIHR